MADSDVEDALFPLPYISENWIGCGCILPRKLNEIPTGLSDLDTS